MREKDAAGTDSLAAFLFLVESQLGSVTENLLTRFTNNNIYIFFSFNIVYLPAHSQCVMGQMGENGVDLICLLVSSQQGNLK